MAPPTKAPAGAAAKEHNEYIPSFISKRPFYAADGDDDNDNDYLKHQRKEEKEESKAWYDRGRKAGPAATRYRKGACENCGAMTHKAKDCLSRPRAKGAKWTGKNIQADEVIQDVNLGWDAKRDRWNGYDAREYRKVVEDYQQMEALRKQAKRLAKPGGEDDDDDDDEEQDDEGDKYAETNDMSKHQSTATRQLRIREDTAKYLLNLDLESAKYDPKTRTLVDGGAMKDKASELFAEEGFQRSSGDAGEMEKAQRLAWETQELSGNTALHLQANPTAGEFYRKKAAEEAEKKRAEREKMLMDKYGSADQKPLPASLRNMAVTESEVFVEYDETGLIKGQPRKKVRSKYAEDVMVNNHTSVWGSWWFNFKWGFACCHSTVKNSYCTGEEGKQAWQAAERQKMGDGLKGAPEENDEGNHEENHKENHGEEGVKNDDEKQDGPGKTAPKRTREEMMNGITEAEMDEYRRKRTATHDPMAKLLGKDDLVDMK